MFKKIIEAVTGSFEAKKEYKNYKKRIQKLPDEYKNAMLSIQTYMWHSSLLDVTNDLYDILDMFEISVAEGKKVENVIGNNIVAFCDEIILSNPAKTWQDKYKEKITKKINKKYNKTK